jgi:hypothetical protein
MPAGTVAMSFECAFAALTGHQGPFRWQTRLYEDWFAKGEVPAACTLPTMYACGVVRRCAVGMHQARFGT